MTQSLWDWEPNPASNDSRGIVKTLKALSREVFGAGRIQQDYLAGNGGVPDATRLLAYRISGGSVEVTALTKRILGEPSTDRGCVGDQPQQRSNSNRSWRASFCCAHALGP
jgi:hypothetical protein